MSYPRFTYRHKPAGERIQGVHVDILPVGDEDEHERARKLGYHDTPAEAGEAANGKAAKTAEASTDDPRPALRAEYEALTGKNAFSGWSAEVLAEKIAAARG